MQLGWLAHKRIPHTHAHTHTHDERLNPLTNAREHRRTMYAHATSVCCASSDEKRAFGCTRVQAHIHDTHQCSLSQTNTHDANATKTHTHTYTRRVVHIERPRRRLLQMHHACVCWRLTAVRMDLFTRQLILHRYGDVWHRVCRCLCC